MIMETLEQIHALYKFLFRMWIKLFPMVLCFTRTILVGLHWRRILCWQIIDVKEQNNYIL